MTTITTITVRGHQLRSRSNRRYVVVAVRPEDIAVEGEGIYVAFARIERRSDNIQTARAAQRRYGFQRGSFAVVVDTVTGEEV